MSEPVIYIWANTGAFVTLDGANFMVNATANSVRSTFGNAISIAANTFAAGNTLANVSIFSNNVDVHVGNSTVNVVINSTSFTLANTTASLQINIASSLGGTTNPGGANTNIQFNDSGAFGGVAGLTFNKTTNTISIGNSTVNATINSTSYSGGVLVGPTYVQNTDSRVLSGNLDFSGANVVFDTRVVVGGQPGNATSGVVANTTVIYIGNSSVNTSINSTSFAGTANNASFIGGVGAANANMVSINFLIDGGGSVLSTGLKGYIEVPFGCTINRATLLADRAGNVVVNIWKTTYSSFDAGGTHPVVGDKITASAPPTISASGTKSQDATLTGWTTAITAGDILAFNVDSVAVIQRVTLALKVTKT